jgi:rhodanese-related sulfurtransferase
VLLGGLPAWKNAGCPVYLNADNLQQQLLQRDSIIILDVRDQSEVERDRIPSAVSMPGASISQQLNLLPQEKSAPIVLYDAEDGKAVRAFHILRKAGYSNITVLDGGITQWRKKGLSLENSSISSKITYVPVPREGVVSKDSFLIAVRSYDTNIQILDVRSDEEAAEGIIKGALHIPADEITSRMQEIPKGKKILVYCKSGVRAEMVQAILKREGFRSEYLDMIVDVKENGSFTLQDKG